MKAGGGEAGGEVVADASVHGFLLGFEDAFVFRDEEVEFLVGVGDGADLVVIVYEVSDSRSAWCCGVRQGELRESRLGKPKLFEICWKLRILG